MVPPYSHRVSRVRRYSGYRWLFRLFVYRTLTFFGWTSHSIPLNLYNTVFCPNPESITTLGLALPRSLATTYGISVDFSSSPYLDVSVRRFPSYTYVFSIWWQDFPLAGLLHSEICGSKPTYGSPQLIAVSHVLLRLSVPRHSPCALCSLTIMRYLWFFFFL